MSGNVSMAIKRIYYSVLKKQMMYAVVIKAVPQTDLRSCFQNTFDNCTVGETDCAVRKFLTF